jgi:hypothetical protein
VQVGAQRFDSLFSSITMPSAAPVIARNLFLMCHLVALWNERHGAPTWLMIGCAGAERAPGADQ